MIPVFEMTDHMSDINGVLKLLAYQRLVLKRTEYK